MKNLAYAKISVEGIQNYICGCGKLKEMIGASEIIHRIATPEFYNGPLAEAGCESAVEAPDGKGGWHIPAQANAGVLCLILPSREAAKKFMAAYGRAILEKFPGLPVYGAVSVFNWNDADKSSYQAARKEADNQISAKRASQPVATGPTMLPVLRRSPLDGLPVVAKDGEELISLISAARRDREILDLAQKRLRELVPAIDDTSLDWTNDLAELLGVQAGEKNGKVALIHIDGNKMGALFKRKLETGAEKPLAENIKAMRELSLAVAECVTGAFAHAATKLAKYLLTNDRNSLRSPPDVSASLLMPLRPLVLGGDDLTIIARADIALAFVALFTRAFERLGEEKGLTGEDRLTAGAGMVVMPASWPFARAFPLSELLLESAKKAGRDKGISSLDYLVITEEVEARLDVLRERVFKATDGAWLTSKPFLLEGGNLAKFMADGGDILSGLPRSQLRASLEILRKGRNAAQAPFLNLEENIARGLSGRKGKLLSKERFARLFPEESFFEKRDGEYYTKLGDWLELDRLLPSDSDARKALLELIQEDNKNA